MAEVDKNNKYKNYNKEKYIETQRKNRERAYQMIDTRAVEVGRNMDNLLEYLDVQTRFDIYTPPNALLVTEQKPSATYCREKANWEKDDIHVTAAENKGIIILKRTDIVRDDGSSQMYYNPRIVYDISDTDAHEMPEHEEVNKEKLLQNMLKSSPFEVAVVDNVGVDSKYARCDTDEKKLYIARTDNPAYLIQDVSMELAKYYLSLENEGGNKDLINFKATCASYMFCKKYNIEFPREQFAQQKNILEGDAKAIKVELKSINDTYLKVKDRVIAEIEKNRKGKEQER